MLSAREGSRTPPATIRAAERVPRSWSDLEREHVLTGGLGDVLEHGLGLLERVVPAVEAPDHADAVVVDPFGRLAVVVEGYRALDADAVDLTLEPGGVLDELGLDPYAGLDAPGFAQS